MSYIAMRTKTTIIFLGLFFLVISCSQEAPKQEETEPGLECYMPYSVRKDHMVFGCEIEGYHMRYDLAQPIGIFMILLPNEYDEFEKTPVYFAINTLSLDNGSLQNLFNNDIQGMLSKNPGTKVIKKLQYDMPMKNGKTCPCLGAEMNYPKGSRFPWETFYICETGSQKYAIVLSIGARTQKDHNEHKAAFMRWVNVPQVVKDAEIVDGK